MPKVSINILTKNRAQLLHKALLSAAKQSFADYEVIVVDDGSTDNTKEIFSAGGGSAFGGKNRKIERLKIITHPTSLGIIASRQEALAASTGEYVAILDDDDEWIDVDKLKKQVGFLDGHPDYVLVGGAISIGAQKIVLRSQSNYKIKNSMLFRNNFFTSTVMFRRQAAVKAGGFIKDGVDLAEDYDLWLRMGKFGKMYNFQEAFVNYRQPSYNKEKLKGFLSKQLGLIKREKGSYPYYWLAAAILKLRLLV